MTGGADFKEEIIGEIVKAEHFIVGHDAPTALFGATAGKPGIVVIAGTGSVVYGENERGRNRQNRRFGLFVQRRRQRFWLALQTIRLAIKEQDGLIRVRRIGTIGFGFFRSEKRFAK
jgi:N-acetylglucosamine kinase-like BadF-type ATPase